ncbi:MAG: zinc-dependent metalloprotease [Bacteroidales bacterium]|nr:zinc-dependent metalloprotease [Bacteroidales bacterium]
MHLILSILTAITLLNVPKEKVGAPLLCGSRIVDVNQPRGKVFAPGQRNPQPMLAAFRRAEGGLVLAPLGGQRGRRQGPPPAFFPIVEETEKAFVINLEPWFSTYPEPLSAIPPKMLGGRAIQGEVLSTAEMDRYLQVTGHYKYASGLEVTAACYFLYLREAPMPERFVDPWKAGYTRVEHRGRGSQRPAPALRWDLTGGRTIDFYVDRTFPAEWFPYIKEGIEDWNKAFRSAGLGDVLAVHPEPEGLDTSSPLVNMVRYMEVEESNAKGDVLFDPRSGEILQGDILWWKNVVDLIEGWRYVQTGAADPAARQADYPIDLLGPMIRHAVCHEMGHVLGLSHNMGASWAYPTDSLRDVRFTQRYGTSASVMDYARYNHLATAKDVAAGVNLLPPRIGPYDYYAIALGYGSEEPVPGEYCYFAPVITAAISPDPSSQAESLGNDLLRSSGAGLENCRTLLSLNGLTPGRQALLRKSYYRYISLALSNIGGTVNGVPVDEITRNKTLKFVFEALDSVPAELKDEREEQRILNELVGHFLPERILRTCGMKSLERYGRELRRYARKHPRLPLKDENEWILNNQT